MSTLKKACFPGFENQAGDATCPTLDPNGAVPVSFDSGTCIRTGFNAVDLTETGGTPDSVLISEVVIPVDETFNCLEWQVSSNVDVKWTLCRVDDAAGTPVESEIHSWITNPAAPNPCCKLECAQFNTTGGTGEQRFRLKAETIDANCLGCAMGQAATRQAP